MFSAIPPDVCSYIKWLIFNVLLLILFLDAAHRIAEPYLKRLARGFKRQIRVLRKTFGAWQKRRRRRARVRVKRQHAPIANHRRHLHA